MSNKHLVQAICDKCTTSHGCIHAQMVDYLLSDYHPGTLKSFKEKARKVVQEEGTDSTLLSLPSALIITGALKVLGLSHPGDGGNPDAGYAYERVCTQLIEGSSLLEAVGANIQGVWGLETIVAVGNSELNDEITRVTVLNEAPKTSLEAIGYLYFLGFRLFDKNIDLDVAAEKLAPWVNDRHMIDATAALREFAKVQSWSGEYMTAAAGVCGVSMPVDTTGSGDLYDSFSSMTCRHFKNMTPEFADFVGKTLYDTFRQHLSSDDLQVVPEVHRDLVSAVFNVTDSMAQELSFHTAVGAPGTALSDIVEALR